MLVLQADNGGSQSSDRRQAAKTIIIKMGNIIYGLNRDMVLKIFKD